MQSLPLERFRALTLETTQSLPLEQGGSASQAVTALAAEVCENVKLRQIRWCVCVSRLHRMVGSARLTRVSGWLAQNSCSAHTPTVVLLALLAVLVAWWRSIQAVRALLTWLYSATTHLTSPCCAPTVASVAVKDRDACSIVEQLAGQLAMHVAASDPQYLSLQTMPTAVVDAQRAAFQSQVRLNVSACCAPAELTCPCS